MDIDSSCIRNIQLKAVNLSLEIDPNAHFVNNYYGSADTVKGISRDIEKYHQSCNYY